MAERKPSDDKAAFGFYPQMKPKRSKQDPEAAKNFPVDLARGVVAGTLGIPGDIESLARLPYELYTGNASPTFLPTSEDILKRIPFGSDTPVSQFAAGLGTLAGGSANLGALPRVVKAAPGALKTAARNLSTPSTLNPQAGVIKMKGGNWLGGNLMGNIDRSVRGLRPYRDAEKRLEAAQAALMRHEADPYSMPHMIEGQKRVIENYKKEVALNNWVESNIGKYVKNQMATPEDPIRLLLDKRTKEIEAKHAKDLQRAERVALRAMDEPDPRRRANMIRESERLKIEANVERQFAMDSIIPSRMQDYSPDADYSLRQRRQEAGFPAEGMGESEAAKRYETLTDDAIVSMRAGDVQETKNILAQAQEAERAVQNKKLEVAKRFDEHIRNSGLNEDQVRVLNEKTPIADKADMIQDREYGELSYAYNKLRSEIRRDEFAAAQENPFIEKLAPETMLYSGNTADMGFDHVIDILKQDVMEGRIRPEQLNKVSVEDAVRRTMEFDQEAARKMAEAQIKSMEGFPVYKEYPEGYRWIELKAPEINEDILSKLTPSEREYYDRYLQSGDTPMDALRAAAGDKNPAYKALEDALKYEGDTMGHCVGGYCPDVLEGKSRIFSLRDARGEPHVTVEVNPSSQRVAPRHEEILAEMKASGLDTSQLDEPAYDAAYEQALQRVKQNRPPAIAQIKGKQNARPVEKYDKYTQDFVKSGKYSEVGDLQNTGLFRLGNEYMTEAEAAAKYKPMTQEALNFLETHPAFEQHRIADKAYSGFKGDPLAPEYREIERAAGAPVSPNVPYTYRELRALLSSPEDWTERDGTIYDPISKAIEKLNEAKKELGLDLPPPEGMKRGGRVHISDNPDVMMLEVNDKRMQAGGLAKLLRAAPKSKAEIEAIAERMAPQMLGEFVRGEKGTQSIAGKTQKQFAKEKEMTVDVRPSKGRGKVPKAVSIEKLKDQVMIGIPGDPTIANKTLYGINDMRLDSPSPQHGGPLYGLENDADAFWASGLGAANRVQNLAREAGQQYDLPVLGNYIMMGPESINYAQHFADANLSAINPAKMSKGQIEAFNNLVREGYPYVKNKERFQRVFPAFPGIENPSEAYLHFAIDPELRKHFNALMQMPTVTEKFSLPSGTDVRFAITEPDLRDLEVGVTGKAIGRMRPEVEDLNLSSHPTYSHDIPGEFMGSSNYPMPYELSFPDTVKAVRENPKQAPHEFGSLKMVGPRQVIDQQMIDEIRMYEERMKALTGKKAGGAVTFEPKVKADKDKNIQKGAPAKLGGKVAQTPSRDMMFLELSNKKLKRK